MLGRPRSKSTFGPGWRIPIIGEAVRQVRESRKALSEVTAFIRGKMEEDESGWCEECLAQLDRTTNRDTYRERLDAHYAGLNSIEIRDTGEGMSFGDLSDVYLRIGTRHRRRQNEGGATKLGDKGIGRLSAMRLGELLTVETSTEGERHWNVLDVDWGVFSHSQDMLVQDIEVAPERGRRKRNRNDHGTTIRIRSLSADWTWIRFTELLDGKVARFIDPFEAGLANRLLVARHNGKRVMIPSIPKPLMKHAHAICRATFRFDGGGPSDRGNGGLQRKAV